MTSLPGAQLVASIALIAAVALAAFAGENRAAPPARRPDGQSGPTGATLVASGKGYFLHAVPLASASRMVGFGGRQQVENGGVMLLHTTRTDGKMTVLLRTGSYTSTNRELRHMPTHTIVTRLVGLVQTEDQANAKPTSKDRGNTKGTSKPPGKEYLYALTATAYSRPIRHVTSVGATLTVWDLQTGAQVASTPMPQRPTITLPSTDALTPGPLKLTKAGLTWQDHNLLFTIKDGKLTTKPLTPPK